MDTTRLRRLIRLVAAFYLVQFRFYVHVLAAVRILPAPLAATLLRAIPPASTVLHPRSRVDVNAVG